MTKRKAILAAMGAIVGIMSQKAKTEPLGTTSDIAVKPQISQFVQFSFDTFHRFEFSCQGETVTLSGKEIFDALKERR